MQASSATRFHRDRLAALAVAVAALLFPGAAATAAEIKVGGTGSALGSMRLLADAFTKQNPDVRVTVLPSIGTSGAIKAVPKGGVDIGLSSRELTPEELKLGVIAFEYARTPLVFAVAAKSRTTALTFEQLADIYGGKTTSWHDGSTIRPVLRQSGDDTTLQVKGMSPAIAAALTAAEKLPGMPFATTDQEAADKTESVPGALGVTTLAQIISESRALRALTLNGVEPTAGNGATGRYPHVKRLFMLTRTEPAPAVKRFIAFMQAPSGREVLVRAGHWIP